MDRLWSTFTAVVLNVELLIVPSVIIIQIFGVIMLEHDAVRDRLLNITNCSCYNYELTYIEQYPAILMVLCVYREALYSTEVVLRYVLMAYGGPYVMTTGTLLMPE